ncbi:LysR family transcriptional regulator [Paracidovorax oryzae]|uniref:LysR family transcriptional regulator n=1 Tax=Paracidovorax oryzae TaxID=862720 RepID=UPI0002E1BFF0|nr:LysR family transcriptional regulator [Paracidovorax oryzae]
MADTALPRDELAIRLENRLKMRHYVLLLAIDRHRSISRAADELQLSQPTVTRALADIEDIFMAPLFVRTRRGLEPTPAGEVVLARARFAAADNHALRRELEGLRAGHQGRLRLGVIPYAPDAILDAAWHHLLGKRPRLSLQAHEDTTLNLIAALRNRTLDCALCRFSQDSSADDLEQELLYQQTAHIVVSRDSAHSLKRLASPDVGQLSQMDWIFPPSNTPIRHMIDAMFAAGGRRVPVPVLEAYATRTIASALVRLPRGVTLLPLHTAELVAADGRAVVMPEPLPWRMPPISLAWLRGNPKSQMACELVAAIRERLRADEAQPEAGKPGFSGGMV